MCHDGMHVAHMSYSVLGGVEGIYQAAVSWNEVSQAVTPAQVKECLPLQETSFPYYTYIVIFYLDAVIDIFLQASSNNNTSPKATTRTSYQIARYITAAINIAAALPPETMADWLTTMANVLAIITYIITIVEKEFEYIPKLWRKLRPGMKILIHSREVLTLSTLVRW